MEVSPPPLFVGDRRTPDETLMKRFDEHLVNMAAGKSTFRIIRGALVLLLLSQDGCVK